MPPKGYSDDSPFFASAELDTNPLKKALAQAEAYYNKFSRGVEKATDALEDQEAQAEKAGREAKDRASDEEKEQKKRVGWFKGIRNLIDREKDALDDLGISWKSVRNLIGGVAAVGLIGKLTKDYLEFDKMMREVNVTLGQQPKLLEASRQSIQGLTGYLYMTREELVGVAKAMGEVRLVTEDMKGSSRIFRGMMLDTIHLSKAIDVSADSVVGMYDQFTRVYKLPHFKLRNISASMKFIQEATSISGQELMSFAQGLDDVVSRMIKTTGEGKSAATADMMAMAGVFKTAGIAPEKMSQLFGEAMKIHSSQGARFLAMITEDTEYSMQQVRSMLEAGDIQTPTQLLIRRMRKEGPEWLKINERWLTEVTGFTFNELSNIQQMSEQGLVDMMQRNRKEYEKGQAHAKAAMKRQHEMSRRWNDLKRILENIWLRLGKVVVQLLTSLQRLLFPVLMKGLKYLTDWSDWAASPQGGKEISRWFKGMIEWFKQTWRWISVKLPAAFDWLMDKIQKVTDWWNSLSDTQKLMVAGAGGLLLFFNRLSSVFAMLGGKVTAVVAGLTALYIGAKKVADWVDEQQTKKIKAFSEAKATTYAIGMKRTAAEKMGFLRGEMTTKGGRGLLTSTGDINMAELRERAAAIYPLTWEDQLTEQGMRRKLQEREVLVAQWKAGLAILLSGVDKKKLQQQIKQQRAAVKPAAVTVPTVAPMAKPPTAAEMATTAAPAAAPRVTVQADSPAAISLLSEIRDSLAQMARQGKTGHPSRQVVSEVLG